MDSCLRANETAAGTAQCLGPSVPVAPEDLRRKSGVGAGEERQVRPPTRDAGRIANPASVRPAGDPIGLGR